MTYMATPGTAADLVGDEGECSSPAPAGKPTTQICRPGGLRYR